MSCQQAAEGALAERYTLGQLSDPEREAFERHYFECARCFEDLELHRALARSVQVARPARVGRRRLVKTPSLAWTAAAAVVAVIATSVLVFRSGILPSGGSSSSVPPRSPGPTLPGLPPVPPRGSMADLARVQPPPYVPPTLRGSDPGRGRFRRAMDAFVRGDHAAAVPDLRAAAAGEPGAADVQFFLGTALLLAGEPEAAVPPLRRTIALGDTPFLEEAHFYLAKVHLRRGAVEEAKRELDRVVQLGGERAAEARALLRDLHALEATS